MLFNSHVFLFAFLPATLLVFFLLGRAGRRDAALLWLTVASLFFYGWWAPANLPIIGLSLAWNFALGRILSARHLQEAGQRFVLISGITGNLVLLGYYKYTGFLAANANALFGTTFATDSIVLPLGISFFTFQQISYLVDAHRGRTREHSFLHYCLFVTFFPQLIAGPIVHHGEMLPQFARNAVFTPRRRNLEVGLTIFFIGLFKKTVIADGVAPLVSPVFTAADNGLTVGGVDAWCGAIAYSLQLYFDFSAYSDMAIGLGRLFGIRLPLNFHSPYQAANLIDFWRRWHLTLSRFLREYLYIPLGGGRKGPARRYVNLMITMLLGGLWHGAGWTFVVWGGLHGLGLTINHLWRTLRGAESAVESPGTFVGRFASRGLTFVIVVTGWVIFRASSLDAAGSLLRSMAGLNGFARPIYVSGGSELMTLALLLMVVWFAPNTQQIMQRFRPAYEQLTRQERASCPNWLQWRRNIGWGMVMSAMTVVAVLHLSRISEFLYFQF